MPRYRVVATDDRHHGHAEERSVLAAVADADAVLCDQAPMPAEVIGALSRCRVISRYGVGCDNVAVAAATARGIWVANVPDYCVEEVSDHTLALVLACMRRLPLLDREVRAGKWNVGSAKPIHRLQGKNYGLVGYGLIARTVHRKLAGFQFGQVLVYDPFVPAASNPLLQLSTVIVSDHVAYYSRESITELKLKAARNVAEVLAGRPPLYPVNRPASPGL